MKVLKVARKPPAFHQWTRQTANVTQSDTCSSDRVKMLGSNSYEFNNTMECRDRDDDDSIGGGGYNNINVLRNGRGKSFFSKKKL